VHPGGKFARAGVQTDPDGQPSARNVLVDQIADLRLQHLHLARQVDRNLALLPIDGADLDRDLEAVLGAIAAPITRHRFHPRDYGKIDGRCRTPIWPSEGGRVDSN